ncbi:phage terminase large subunit family protein [Pseudomonas saxonica]|uniref:phage terminase large subunit family protein n=1 Tax=Pseudomonas saxonica TaxID=2600598 RepID=UPI002D7A0029|nr:hypothetical protein [Pseudomonas saxonica]WRQ77363.1 hypothetical protein VQY67_16190 [Pseudomonas saxonica]
MRSMAAAICSTWSSCSWSTTKTNSSSCFTANSSTAAKARSASRDLERCYSDLSLWEDYNPELDRPFGNSPVWLGYDPSRTRDDATCVVVAPPLEPGAKFRILEKHSWRGHSFNYQAAQVKKLTERFNVQHIGIDITGVGYGVFDLVRDFYPKATPIHYSLETKNLLVHQGPGHDPGKPHRMGRRLAPTSPRRS